MRILLISIVFVLLSTPPAAAAPLPTGDGGVSARSILPRRPIDDLRVGLNAFFNDPRFGSIESQMDEARSVLGIRQLRVLFAWNDDVQPSPETAPNFSFYDDILRALPRGSQALVILTGVPSWMSDSRNWIGGDPRRTFVERWVRPVAKRYAKTRGIVGYEIWNEQNDSANPDNELLGIADSPENYVSMLILARRAIKSSSRRRKVVCGATTAINQNFPETLTYNEEMVEAGAQRRCDIYAIHYYGSHLENFLFGVGDFLRDLKRPIWITESGEKGVNNQRSYVEEIWPFLAEQAPRIRRFYYYQFTEDTPADSTYGLRNLTPGRTVSDLYIYLRDR